MRTNDYGPSWLVQTPQRQVQYNYVETDIGRIARRGIEAYRAVRAGSFQLPFVAIALVAIMIGFITLIGGRSN